jgi:imidazoleglycerol-phosphate dehydratase / histidinol-phosphatase
MQKYLFIDRDGTLLQSPPPGGQVDAFEKLHFYPHVITWLGKIAHELPYKLVMVTNQNGLGSPLFPHEIFLPTQNFMLDVFKNEDIVFHDIIVDESLPEENSPLRKPRTGRMTAYLEDSNADIKNSFVIGDRLTDMQFAKNMGCKGIFLNPDNLRGQAELTDSIEELKTNWVSLSSPLWEDVYHFLKSQ